ncbi:uncharacterized protein LOC113557882 [Rhopalosiphum maidis]|uniref:uncharacterized protein LOC113557882 n=1 Tax=Rhopalosiphum maidis TaxID=43146 RepID=UPI000EFF6F59|nr:uncharacterized protein LOC113557882 [Rhopalosiphum maidis]
MKKEKRKVRSVKLQVNRIKKATKSLCSEKNCVNTIFENSMLGDEIKKLRKTIEDQYSIIGTFSVSDSIQKLKAILEQNAKNEIVDRKLNERYLLTVELKELDMALITVQQELENTSKQFSLLEKERRVLAHLMTSTYQEKNKNVEQ